MYKVIVAFRDLQDKKRYAVGDIYTGNRAKELASAKNKAKMPLIEEVPEPKAKEPEVVEEPVPVEEPVAEEAEVPKKTRGRKKGK